MSEEKQEKQQREIKRRHYLVEKLQCRDMVDRMLAEGYGYEDIAQAVFDAGERIGKSSICRYHNSMSQVAERVIKAREQVKVLVDVLRDRPGTDIAEAAEQVMLQGLLQKVATADEEDFEEMSLAQAGRLIGTLSRSGVNREKFKLQYNQGVGAAVDRIMGELRVELAGMPDVLTVLAAKLETVRTELTAGQG
ncbi:phage protein Gp27 family protein [Sporomusa sp. KB1]|jgi:hypothetical protein|uniref:phage protein Gp27 family protein n=1 Tax=Sporomusa sp. KB1 TaxID=943346 RepID=UPI0011A03FDF|nr:phage protein Gp27 family protein [Sporomusa sp. KB1]TWH45907.1 uncharacterized protein DUF3486 [Sporomusa sp. KB1]